MLLLDLLPDPLEASSSPDICDRLDDDSLPDRRLDDLLDFSDLWSIDFDALLLLSSSLDSMKLLNDLDPVDESPGVTDPVQ